MQRGGFCSAGGIGFRNCENKSGGRFSWTRERKYITFPNQKFNRVEVEVHSTEGVRSITPFVFAE